MSVFVLSDPDGKPAVTVAGCDDGILREDEYRCGAVDHLLRVQDSGNEIILLVYECGDKLCGVYLSGTHGHELMAVIGEILFYELFRIVYRAYGCNGKHTQMRAYQKRLRVGIAYTSDTFCPVKIRKVLFELRSERCILNIMDLPLESVVFVVYGHSSAACTEVGVVVNAEEYIQNAVFFGYYSEKSAHYMDLSFI